jgi:hypothetical protein
MNSDNHLDAPDLNVALPPGFDPILNPIIAKHWFGVRPSDPRTVPCTVAQQAHRLLAQRGVSVLADSHE